MLAMTQHHLTDLKSVRPLDADDEGLIVAKDFSVHTSRIFLERLATPGDVCHQTALSLSGVKRPRP